MGGSLPALSDTQWEVMTAVWDLEEATVSEVWAHLGDKRDIARNTVLTQMDRLVKKGWLQRRDTPNGHLYCAVQSPEETRSQHLRRWLETAFDGAADKLVLSLLKSKRLTEGEVERIQELIDDARRKKS